MTRYLLDTNILSNAVKPQPSEPLLAWTAAQRDETLCIAALTLAEIRRGILDKPRGRKRALLEAWFAGPEGPQALFAGRILPFDDRAALIWASLMAEAKSAGRRRSALDMIIAAVALANGCRIVTDNERDFAGLELLNPMRPGTMTPAGDAEREQPLARPCAASASIDTPPRWPVRSMSRCTLRATSTGTLVCPKYDPSSANSASRLWSSASGDVAL